MNTIILGTLNGNIYVYDMPKALENERILNKRKLEMGVEDELVFTYLERANQAEFYEFISKSMPNHLKSTLSIGENFNQS
jgi:hypothetical protein